MELDALTVVRSVALVVMVAIFVAVALWAFWPRNRDRFRRAAHIPFQDD